MLNGRLDITVPNGYDLLLFEDQQFVAGAPLPALLMLPGVLLWGTAFSDVFFGVAVGALNVVMVWRFLGRLPFAVRDDHRKWLMLLFAFGTPHWYLAALGTVWFNAHVVAVLFLLLYAEAVLTKQHLFAGLFLSLAFLARPSTMYAAIFVLAVSVLTERDWANAAFHWVPFGAGFAPGFGLALLYNQLRFGSFLEFGYDFVQGAENITSAFARYGGFDPGFLRCNFTVSLVGLPDVFGRIAPLTARACTHLLETPYEVANPILSPNPIGMSIFLVTPALLLMFRSDRHQMAVQASIISFLAIFFALWIYHNTGSLQFGFRYLMDATPFWLILLASGTRHMPVTRIRLPVVISILINAWGLLWIFAALNQTSWPG